MASARIGRPGASSALLYIFQTIVSYETIIQWWPKPAHTAQQLQTLAQLDYSSLCSVAHHHTPIPCAAAAASNAGDPSPASTRAPPAFRPHPVSAVDAAWALQSPESHAWAHRLPRPLLPPHRCVARRPPRSGAPAVGHRCNTPGV
jgi:hypothetical protein